MDRSGAVHAGVRWVAIAQSAGQGARFLSNVVLARLLAPEMFGLIAMASVAINVIGVVREVGLGAAFIQRPTESPEATRTAASTTFALLFAVNLLLFVAATLLSPLVAEFFNEPRAEAVLRWMFATFLFDALLTTPSLVLQRRLAFGRYAASEILASVSLAAVSIPCALLGYGVWSLVVGHLGSKAVQTVALYALSGWRPRWEFDPRVARELFSYGKFLWAFAVLSAVGGSLDRAIMGRWIGAATLGVYTLALNLSLLPTRQITSLVNRVSFPALSRIQHDRAALRRATRRALAHVSMLSLPLGLGMVATSRELILTVYGDGWIEAIPILEVLAFYGMALSVSAIHGPLLRAIGKPNAMLYTSVLHHTVLFALLLWLARYGVLGVCYAVLVPVLISSAISFWLVIGYLDFRPAELLAPLLRAAASAAVMYAAVELFQWWLAGVARWPAPAELAAAAAVGSLAYLAATACLNLPMLSEFYFTLRAVVSARGGGS